jgi:hypothetical protein
MTETPDRPVPNVEGGTERSLPLIDRIQQITTTAVKTPAPGPGGLATGPAEQLLPHDHAVHSHVFVAR